MEKLEESISSCLIGDEQLATISTKIISQLLTKTENILTDGFDDEQIFQQIEFLYTNPVIDSADKFDCLEIESGDESDEEPEDADIDESENIDTEETTLPENELEMDEDGERDDGDSEDDRAAEKELRKDFTSYKKTELDDDFFSLRQMEEFCDEEDEKEMNEDFDGDELDDELKDELYGEGDDDDGEEDEEEIMHDNFFKSRFEKRSEKVATELEQLEDEAMQEKAWHLMGETTAGKRHEDELLGMDLDFNAQASETAPTIEMTETVENMIIQRIRDKAYDDVERKSREMVEPAEAKRKLVPDEERKSLSQLYEDQFLQNGKDIDEDKDRKKIKEDMNRLFAQLDFLTYDTVVNQKEVEIKVTSDAPALNSEERGPSLLSTFSSLAPEEVSGKSRGSLMASIERSATDIKRERRRVKAKIKAKKAAGKEVTFKKPKKEARSRSATG